MRQQSLIVIVNFQPEWYGYTHSSRRTPDRDDLTPYKSLKDLWTTGIDSGLHLEFEDLD
jgi:hypothetical protein